MATQYYDNDNYDGELVALRSNGVFRVFLTEAQVADRRYESFYGDSGGVYFGLANLLEEDAENWRVEYDNEDSALERELERVESLQELFDRGGSWQQAVVERFGWSDVN